MRRAIAKLLEFFFLACGRFVELDMARYRKPLQRIKKLGFENETDDRVKDRSTSLMGMVPWQVAASRSRLPSGTLP